MKPPVVPILNLPVQKLKVEEKEEAPVLKT